jgi:phosphoribosylglycinamide formyltransferase-1
VYCKENGIPSKVLRLKEFKDRGEHANAMIKAIDEFKCEVVALAGYMLLVPANFVDHFRYRLINIHPSLLPSFPGVDAISQAFGYGAKVTGVSVIFVSYGCDDGEIILQKPVTIEEDDSLGSLETKIHEIEHEMLWRAVKIVLDGRFKVVDRKVEIL